MRVYACVRVHACMCACVHVCMYACMYAALAAAVMMCCYVLLLSRPHVVCHDSVFAGAPASTAVSLTAAEVVFVLEDAPVAFMPLALEVAAEEF